MTKIALDSYRNCDELILVENGGKANYNCDTYVRHKTNLDFTKGVNSIFKIARGDYILFCANDTYLEKGNIRDLCIPDTVTSPIISTQNFNTPISGSSFCVPKNVLDKVGMLDESMETYYSDTEFIDRLNYFKIKMTFVSSVVVYHYVSKTVNATNKNNSQITSRDFEFYKKAISNYDKYTHTIK